mgnify:CR=1 FL=1
MCGIVGLFLKDKSLEPKLGEMLTEMLITMTDRGPDSAGIAIYGGAGDGRAKITIDDSALHRHPQDIGHPLGSRAPFGTAACQSQTALQ